MDSIRIEMQFKGHQNYPLHHDWYEEDAIVRPDGYLRLSGSCVTKNFWCAIPAGNQKLFMAHTKGGLCNNMAK
jgi:hypothetical protein